MCFVWRGLRKKDIAIDPIPFKTLASRNSRDFYRRNEPAATIPSRVTVRRNRNKGQDATIFGVMQISTRHYPCVMDDAKQFPIFQKSKKSPPAGRCKVEGGRHKELKGCASLCGGGARNTNYAKKMSGESGAFATLPLRRPRAEQKNGAPATGEEGGRCRFFCFSFSAFNLFSNFSRGGHADSFPRVPRSHLTHGRGETLQSK